MNSYLRSLVPAALAAFSLVVGCGGGAPSEATGQDEGASKAHKKNKLLDEGTCQFLACHSSFSPPAQPNAPGAFQCKNGSWHSVSFACTGTSVPCSDDDVWLVTPTRNCGASYRVCFGGKSIVAPVRDSSDASSYEASRGLQAALGIAPGANPRVAIYGANDSAADSDPACNAPPSGGGGGGSSSGDPGSSSGGPSCTPCTTQTCGYDLACGSGEYCGGCNANETCNAYGNCEGGSVHVGGGGAGDPCSEDGDCDEGLSCGADFTCAMNEN